jgi:hypothetical protein
MSKMTEKMSEAGSGKPATAVMDAETPKKGDRFRCTKCAMEIEVTVACGCKEAGHVHFHCCGQQLQAV